MAYTLNRYVWDSARLKAAVKLLAELESQHTKAVFFPEEHTRLLMEIQEIEAAMERYELYNHLKKK